MSRSTLIKVGIFLAMTGIAVLARPVVTKIVTQIVNELS
jgi:hypothetical protein